MQHTVYGLSSTPLFLKPRTDSRPNKREISVDELEEIRFAFETLDAERTGYVTPKQLKVALRAMGFPVKKADIGALLRKHGEEESEKLDYDAFKRVACDKLSERTPMEDMRRAFQLFDIHGLGKIDAPTLRKISRTLGMEIDDAELQDMVNEFDQDNDGMINEQEFMAIMAANDE